MITLYEYKSAVRDAPGNHAGVRFPDHILGAGNDQSPCTNRFEFIRMDIRIIDHQSKHLCVQPRGVTLFGKVFSHSVTDLDGNLNRPLDPSRIQVRSVQDQTVYTVRIPDRKNQGDIPAVRKSEKMCLLNLMIIHETQQVIRKLPYRKRLISSGCFSMSSGIDCIHMIPFGESFHLTLKIIAVLSVAVKENHRLSLSAFYVVVLYIHESSLIHIVYAKVLTL